MPWKCLSFCEEKVHTFKCIAEKYRQALGIVANFMILSANLATFINFFFFGVINKQTKNKRDILSFVKFSLFSYYHFTCKYSWNHSTAIYFNLYDFVRQRFVYKSGF